MSLNWGAMSSREVRSYAPLHASTPLEKALVLMMEEDARGEEEDSEAHAEACAAWDAQAAAESALTRLKDELFDILNDEDGDDAHLLKRVREVLDAA